MKDHYSEKLDTSVAKGMLGSKHDPECDYYLISDVAAGFILVSRNRQTGEEVEVPLSENSSQVTEEEMNYVMNRKPLTNLKWLSDVVLLVLVGVLVVAMVLSIE